MEAAVITENRWLHILGVARKAKVLAEKMRPDEPQFAEDMFLLGMLHDFGYEFTENGKNHGPIGAEILKRQGYRHWQAVADHGSTDVTEVSDVLFILSCADMTVSADGKDCTMEERIISMAERYGEKSRPHQKAIAAAKWLRSDPRYIFD